MPTYIIIILSGFGLYLIYTLIKIQRLKVNKSVLMKEYVESGGLTEEQKEQKEIDEKINALVRKVIDCKDGKHKVEVMSKNYKDWLSSDKEMLKSFEYELSKIAPELLKVNILERLILLVFKIITGVIVLCPFALLSGMLKETAIDGMIGVMIWMIPIFISVFIWRRVPWIKPIRYNTAVRYFRGYKF